MSKCPHPEKYAHLNGSPCDHKRLDLCPEDREQVERLAREAFEGTGKSLDRDTSALQAALRSLLAPPKPSEPQGRGAVVEDARLFPWTRFSHSESHDEGDWINEDGVRRQWADIAAVRVLSEGIR